jgi:putative pre-16S rRNA nuclease
VVHGRILAVDVGARRVGLAISDASGTLARPLETIAVTSDADAVERVASRIDRLAGEDDGLAAIVVGMPTRLDGTPSPQTSRVAAFIDALKGRTALTIVTEGEALTSREAESRLAVREHDWRKRKAKLDAAAAAIILQDYLDRAK